LLILIVSADVGDVVSEIQMKVEVNSGWNRGAILQSLSRSQSICTELATVFADTCLEVVVD
jgi:hypothetical protein